ncbi:MAG TPA: type 4a pilus biogenesis protein PilO [Gammaproteobacteria bacterium]|jgi:type IV pilus assembly protein PilO|nr:pilus assembly protein PilO [Chromatiales bacterium]MCP4926672.1 type 4a pilus biogenesis protein PilO [Gammaproteobacteria bacterium]MDP7153778.1 type 4a pilus biogenesis protein PilO [Gammaproteobacteria bacterium]MDP7295961.1 type 4a pilus biogenesis protein PilO [Gammaproteobacteria bacterium]MDP7661093.1 type 4a pilus biogenesis protein PilO [Gammaproteobacteria bacterium]
MNFLEELQNLDFNDIGRWPLLFRVLFVSLFFIFAVSGGFYYFVYTAQMPRLERAEQEEQELRISFEQKQKKAANFSAYSEQLAEIERSFGTMLRQLPGKTEIPNLLVDISQTGLAAGLQEELFQPVAELQKDFYAEKPIKIRLKGTYHEFGRFVSDIAALPRIVTLHDIAIKQVRSGDNSGNGKLILNVTAKTYRYLDEDTEMENAG